MEAPTNECSSDESQPWRNNAGAQTEQSLQSPVAQSDAVQVRQHSIEAALPHGTPAMA